MNGGNNDCWFRLFVFSGFALLLADNISYEWGIVLLTIGWLVTSWLDWRVR